MLYTNLLRNEQRNDFSIQINFILYVFHTMLSNWDPFHWIPGCRKDFFLRPTSRTNQPNIPLPIMADEEITAFKYFQQILIAFIKSNKLRLKLISIISFSPFESNHYSRFKMFVHGHQLMHESQLRGSIPYKQCVR